MFTGEDSNTVVMYGCESWTIKKAVHQRIDAFKPVNPKGNKP